MTRVLLRVATAASLLLGGCGYKPLSAPCAMDEGARPAQGVGVEASPRQPLPPTENTIQALSYAGLEVAPVAGPFIRVAKDECGPLRPINSGGLR